VRSTPLVEGTTGSDGIFRLQMNPFIDSTTHVVEYPLFLVRAVLGADTAYGWLPRSEMNNAWFADSTKPFRLTLRF
jgi:hypothetical protein